MRYFIWLKIVQSCWKQKKNNNYFLMQNAKFELHFPARPHTPPASSNIPLNKSPLCDLKTNDGKCRLQDGVSEHHGRLKNIALSASLLTKIRQRQRFWLRPQTHFMEIIMFRSLNLLPSSGGVHDCYYDSWTGSRFVTIYPQEAIGEFLYHPICGSPDVQDLFLSWLPISYISFGPSRLVPTNRDATTWQDTRLPLLYRSFSA